MTPKAGAQVAVRFVIDGRKHSFSLQENQFEAKVQRQLQQLHALVAALRASTAGRLNVEFPKQKVPERFSLLNVRRALCKPSEPILEGCGD